MVAIKLVYGITLLWVQLKCMGEEFPRGDLLSLKKKMKYILIWTSPNREPIKFMGRGQTGFFEKRCAEKNCYVTANRKYLQQNITYFDIILFHGPEILQANSMLPPIRSPRQLYVFVSQESSANYPCCNQNLNGNFFNWTWTYKLKSDQLFEYLIIKDKEGNTIGPKKHMHWLKVTSMKPIREPLKNKLQRKRKAAAWFVSNCHAFNDRRQVASQIRHELKRHGHTLDVYGGCGRMKCTRGPRDNCARLIDEVYYFYLAFENSFGEDYVTEKLLRALKHYAVPVVYGGANYTRFMPDGIYLNVKKLGVLNTVKTMVYLINNQDHYYNYFRWHNHYSYHDPNEFPETDPYCRFCAAVNDDRQLTKYTNYNYFDVWWNELYPCLK